MKKILVADDQEGSRVLVRAVLEPAGYVVEEATDGHEALAKIAADPPQLIVLDLHMPGLSGFEVMNALRENQRYRSIPIVALTASAMQGDRERVLAAGFVDYMTKPVSLAVLRSRLLGLLGPKE